MRMGFRWTRQPLSGRKDVDGGSRAPNDRSDLLTELAKGLRDLQVEMCSAKDGGLIGDGTQPA